MPQGYVKKTRDKKPLSSYGRGFLYLKGNMALWVGP